MRLFRRNKDGEDISKGDALDKQRDARIHAAHEGKEPPSYKMSPDFIREMTDHQLDPGTVDVLSNSLSKDIVLAFFTEAETEEAKWMLRDRVEMVERMHPPQGSKLTGEYNQALLDDQVVRKGLKPLDWGQQIVLDNLIDAIFSRMTRGRDGNQQEMFSTQISESIIRDETNQGSGGWIRGRAS